MEVQNAETTVKKIEYPFYHNNYINYYLNYDYTLQKLHPYGAINELIFFQRMVTQMMYQLEDNSHAFKSVVDSYHEYRHPIFCYVQNTSGKMVYQTDSDFPTDADILLERFRIQTAKRILS